MSSHEQRPQAVNRRIVLARRPQGEPTAADFRLEKQPVPAAGAGQLLLRTRFLSLDPYMRGRMSDAPSYAPPVAVGAPMTGQTVSVVEASNAAGFRGRATWCWRPSAGRTTAWSDARHAGEDRSRRWRGPPTRSGFSACPG